MLPQKRLNSLQQKSASLAQIIEKEERSPAADHVQLRHLKKQKLELKEIMEGIRQDDTRH